MTAHEERKYTRIKDAPLVMHNYKTTHYWGPQGYQSSGMGFKLKGANCPNYTTPECAKCDEWQEFMDQTGGPIDGCNPLENCIDCELREPCPCWSEQRFEPIYGWAKCLVCGDRFEKRAGNHIYCLKSCRQRAYYERRKGNDQEEG